MMLRQNRSTRVTFMSLTFLCLLHVRAGAQSATPLAPAPVAQATAPCPEVSASLTATIDTKKVKAGDLFRFSTQSSSTYGGVIIPSGTSGVGLIATLDHSKSQGHAGYLVLEARYLELADGSHVPVSFMPAGDGRSQAFIRAGSSDAGLIGYLPYYIGTAAGVFNTFHHGKDAAVVAGAPLTLVVGDGFYTGDCRIAIDRR